MIASSTAADRPAAPIGPLSRCIDCGAAMVDLACASCGRSYTVRGGIVEAIGPLQGSNRIVASFYDGPGWRRFRPWERAFLRSQGGTRRARMQILRHLPDPDRPTLRVLEVGIGDGANIRFLPSHWETFGVDISKVQLEATLDTRPDLGGRLALAEAESLPFRDGVFDVCFSLGGFTYFNDQKLALREMRRVTRPGGVVVIADENAGLHRAGIGHLLGVPRVDAWWLGGLGLDRAFIDLMFNQAFDAESFRSRHWPEAVRHRIWLGLGYCLVGPSDDSNHEGARDGHR